MCSAISTIIPFSIRTVAGRNSSSISTVREEIVVIASNFGQAKHPAWYHNVRANPEVEVSWDGGGGRYRAREATGEERERYWQKAVADYPGFAARRRRAGRQIPVIVLSPL